MAGKTAGEILREAMASSEEPQEAPGGAPEEQEVPEDQEAQEDEQEAPEGQEEPEEGPPITSLTELAQAIGVDPSELYDLEITLSDSKERIKLGELKDRLQESSRLESTIREKEEQLAREYQQAYQNRQAWQAQETEFTGHMQQAWLAMQQADADFKRIDWDKFDQLDPGKSANEKQKLMARYVAAKEQLQQAQAAHQNLLNEQTQKARAWHDTKTLEAIPEWRDPSVAQTEVPDILAYAKKVGLTDEELSQAWDYRYRTILRDGMLYRKLKESSRGLSTKGLKPLPGGRTGSRSQGSQVADLVKQAKNSNNRDLKRKAQAAVLSQAFRGKR